MVQYFDTSFASERERGELFVDAFDSAGKVWILVIKAEHVQRVIVSSHGLGYRSSTSNGRARLPSTYYLHATNEVCYSAVAISVDQWYSISKRTL